MPDPTADLRNIAEQIRAIRGRIDYDEPTREEIDSLKADLEAIAVSVENYASAGQQTNAAREMPSGPLS